MLVRGDGLVWKDRASSVLIGRPVTWQGPTQLKDVSDPDQTKAIALYTEAIELNPTFGSIDGAYDRRGTIHLRLKDFPSAIADFTKAIQIDGDVAGYYSGRAAAYEAVGDLANADKDRKKHDELKAKERK